jgi:hypothetical protein
MSSEHATTCNQTCTKTSGLDQHTRTHTSKQLITCCPHVQCLSHHHLRLLGCHFVLPFCAAGCRCFGVPLSALFGLKLGMNVRGFWLGLLCTTYSMSAVQLLIIARFNWPREVERAAALLAAHADDAADDKAAALGTATRAGSDAASGNAAAAAEGLDVWPCRLGRRCKDDGARLGRKQQTESDQERVSLLAGAAGGNSSSELVSPWGTAAAAACHAAPGQLAAGPAAVL